MSHLNQKLWDVIVHTAMLATQILFISVACWMNVHLRFYHPNYYSAFLFMHCIILLCLHLHVSVLNVDFDS